MKVKPLFIWAGGKSKMMKHYAPLFPSRFDTDIKSQYYEKLDVKFKDIIRLGYLPSNLTLDYEECISSFIHNNIQYHNNKDYDKCKEILYKFGLIDHLNIFVNFKNIGDIISKLYIKENINSFIPDNNKFCKGGYNYHNNKDVLKDELITMEISIGDYVLSGGELPAAVLCDSIIRLIPGVIGDETSALSDSFQDGMLAPPVYTRPANFEDLEVPKILLSGNKAKIDQWREEKAEERTKKLRPDIFN